MDEPGTDVASATDRDGTPVGRRVVLAMAGLGAAGIVYGSKVQGHVASALRPLTSVDPTGFASLIPGADKFRIYTVTGSRPKRSRGAWRMKVGGLVERPTTLRFADLLDLPAAGLTADFQCVTGWRVPDVPWKGVRLANVLDHVGVAPEATHVRFTSFDGAYSESLSLAQARRDDVLVAYELLGAPVSSDHGGPVRLYVAPMYGYKSIKWLDGIELTAKEQPGYWEGRGYDTDAWVGQSNGRQDRTTTDR
ncbi:MAG: molybdopterin-dependent oxidoreductase [Acidimicrobiales bacterium]